VSITLGGVVLGFFANSNSVNDPNFGSLDYVVSDNNGNEWAVFYNQNYNGNTVLGNIELHAIPEPQTWGALISGFGLILDS